MSPNDSHSLIDSYLTLFHEPNVVTDNQIRDHTMVLFRTHKFQMEEVLTLIKKFGIVEERNSLTGREFVLTTFGYEMFRYGSWTKYLEEKDEEGRLAKEQVKSSIRTNRSQFWILLLTFLVALASVAISWLDYKKDTMIKNEKVEDVKRGGKPRATLDSTVQEIDTIQNVRRK